jgi:hypothetical protein
MLRGAFARLPADPKYLCPPSMLSLHYRLTLDASQPQANAEWTKLADSDVAMCVLAGPDQQPIVSHTVRSAFALLLCEPYRECSRPRIGSTHSFVCFHT